MRIGVGRFVDWFLSEKLREHEGAYLRAYIFVVSHLGGPAVAFPLLAYHVLVLHFSGPVPWILAAALSAFALFTVSLRYVSRLETVAFVANQYLVGVVLLSAYYIGGLESPYLVWLIIPLLGANFYLKRRPTLKWMAIGALIAETIAFLCYGFLGGTFPMQTSTADLLVLGSISNIGFALFVGGLVYQLGAMIESKRRDLRIEFEHRAMAEVKLRQSQERLAMAQHIANLGSMEADFTSGELHWSDEVFRIVGLDPATTKPNMERLRELLHPDDVAIFDRVRRDLRAGKKVDPIELRVIRPDGGKRWLYAQMTAFETKDGGVTKGMATIQDVTDRRRIEEELRRSQESLDLAQQVASMGSSDIDILTRTGVWSDGLYELLGLSREGGRSFEYYLTAFHPDDRQSLINDREMLYRGEPVPPREYRFVRADGEIRWLYRRTMIIRDQSGRAVRYLTTHVDITERKRAEIALRDRETELRQSQERLAMAQHVANLGSMEAEYTTGDLYWSDEVFGIVGLDRATTKPNMERLRELVHPDDRPIFDGVRQNLRAGKRVDPIEIRITRPDGQIRWIHAQTSLFESADGSVVKGIATIQDVTDRREMEFELRQSREHLALAQRVGAIGSAVVDIATGVSVWSDEWYAILGLDRTKVRPSRETFLATVHPDDRHAVDARRNRSLAAQPNELSEYRIVRPDGEVRWIQTRSEVIGDGGAGRQAIVTMQDVTERKRAQMERSELEQQLLQAQKMEAIGNLTGGVAHDFNNLLSIILGRLEMTAAELSDRPQLREWIDVCIKAADRGASLTRSMLAFSRKQPLKPVDLDAAAAVGELMELLPRSLGDAIEIKFVRTADLWRCRVDPVQLQNALLNLALNSRDAMPDGGKLTITVENARVRLPDAAHGPEIAAGDYVVIAVADTGEGMTEEVAARAFDPFFTTKEVGKGSGLGLSMVYGFAKQSGGHVRIASGLGDGTVVKMYLPRSDALSSADAPAVRAKPSIGGTEKLLVVEDNEDVRDLTVALLERLGYSVCSAGAARAALKLLDDNQDIALLLSDISLPEGTNGRELARMAKERRPSLRVLFMSGYSEQVGKGDPGTAVDAAVVEKPFRPEDLARAVRTALI